MSETEILPAPMIDPILSQKGSEKWQRERAAFYRLLPDLLAAHAGAYVAIHDGAIVESGVDFIDVANRTWQRVGYVPIFVEQVVVAPKLPLRVPSPRRAKGQGENGPLQLHQAD
jgi:hypothetical protein